MNKQNINKFVASAIDKIAAEKNIKLDALFNKMSGKSVDAIKPELKKIFAEDGGKISEPELTDFSERISQGQRIQFKAGQVK